MRAADFYRRMESLGFTYDEANRLRRIEMTLHRWSELECGDCNESASWGIERDETTGKPFMVRHPHWMNKSIRTPIADREMGALRRLHQLMKTHPSLWFYHQSDPRGCALYIGKNSCIANGDIASCYTNGVAVCI